MNKNDATIRLRAMEPEDLDALYQIENDCDTWDIGTTNVPYSRYALHDYMARCTSDIYTDKEVRLMIENGQGEVVGIADLTNFDPKSMKAEIGLVIQRQHRSKGYALAALRALHAYASHTLHLHQIYAVIPLSNEHCCHLFRQFGYRESATLTDWLRNGETYQSAVVMQFIFS
jgi:diamine N-acetyltransferase